MIRMISVKCPECGAALEFEEGRQTAFCSYCGAKILLQNENEYIFRTIDEAEIRQAENDREYMLKELAMEEKEEKHHRFLTAVWLILTISLFVIGFIMVSVGPKDPDDPGHMLIIFGIGIGFWGWIMLDTGKKKKSKNRRRPGYLKVPDTSAEFGSMHFSAVEAHLRAAGFGNIRCINLGDLRLGILNKNGSVESITIDGEALSPGEWHPREAPIIISYHGFRN